MDPPSDQEWRRRHVETEMKERHAKLQAQAMEISHVEKGVAEVLGCKYNRGSNELGKFRGFVGEVLCTNRVRINQGTGTAKRKKH